MNVKGILWHSTGANNPTIKRYVQPSSNDKNYKTLMAKIGKNSCGNDWNHISVEAGLNAWIGQLQDGTVTTVQSMPWNYKPWGCGGGAYGSCNDGWIQFEMCEDDLTDKKYFNAIYKEAIELTAYLCKKFNLNPKGTIKHNGITVPVILCHWDSYKLGLGSGHADVYNWFNKFGKTMDDVRNDVAALMKASDTKFVKNVFIGYTQKKTEVYEKAKTNSKVIKTLPKATKVEVIKSNGEWYNVTIDKQSLFVQKSFIAKTKPEIFTKKEFIGYSTVDGLNIRKSNSTNSKILGTLNKDQSIKIIAVGDKKWYKANYKNNTVYVAKEYITDKKPKINTSYKVQVIATNGLNVRKTASTSAKIITVLKYKDKVTITKKSLDKKWGYVESKKGWIALEYTKKI